MRRRLDYICMQPTRQGQASYAHVHEIVAGLERRGWDVRLVEPPHPTPGRWDGLRRGVNALAAQSRYWVRCRFRPARVVYVRTHFLTLPTAILARLSGSLVVQEVNGPASDAFDAWPKLRYLSSLISIAGRTQLRLADAVVVVTPGLEAYVRERTRRQAIVRVIGNGADVERFHPSIGAELAHADHAGPYVVFVGALASWQGVGTVLDALHSPMWPHAVSLVVAGDGRERDRVEAAMRRDPRINWLGTVPYAEIPALLAGSLAALVPKTESSSSQYGLSPLKLYEAMASGAPVIVSDLPGLSDIVRMHDCGLAFPAGDSAALAGAVATLAGDPETRRSQGTRGREAVVARYSWDVRAAETHDLLVELDCRRRQRLDPHGA